MGYGLWLLTNQLDRSVAPSVTPALGVVIATTSERSFSALLDAFLHPSAFASKILTRLMKF